MRLTPVWWKRTLWAAHQVRNSSLRVESSPTRSVSPRSKGLLPAWRAEVGDEVFRHAFPVGVEVDRGGVQEGPARAVGRLLAAVEHRRVEGAAEVVGGDVVESRVARERRRVDRVEDALHGGPDTLLDRAAAAAMIDRRPPRGAGEVVEVGALGLVELERLGERFQHALRDTADVAALEALVVVDADAGERGDLLAPQPGDAPPAMGRQAGLLRGDPRTPGGQELRDLGGRIHAPRVGRIRPWRGALSSPPSENPCRTTSRALQ